MKKYVIMALIVISSLAHAEKRGTASMNHMYGERNEFTTEDPCQAPNVVGCGPCFKACMAQHHGDNAIKTNTTFGRQQAAGNKKASSSGQ